MTTLFLFCGGVSGHIIFLQTLNSRHNFPSLDFSDWVFDIPPIRNCSRNESAAQCRQKEIIHEFNRGVDATKEIEIHCLRFRNDSGKAGKSPIKERCPKMYLVDNVV